MNANSDSDIDWDEPDDDDYDVDEDESATVACGNCGAEVDADSIRCPVCGEYLTTDTRVWSGKPVWYILLALAGIIAVLRVLRPW